MRMVNVGKGRVITGAASTITLDPATPVDHYSVEFKVQAGTPLAGTTAVSATPKGGTAETVTKDGIALNIDPTALAGFYITGRALESITLTPSTWTAGVVIDVTVWGRIE